MTDTRSVASRFCPNRVCSKKPSRFCRSGRLKCEACFSDSKPRGRFFSPRTHIFFRQKSVKVSVKTRLGTTPFVARFSAHRPPACGLVLGLLSAYVFGPLALWGLGPLASGGLDSHLSEVEEFLMGLGGPPEPILCLGLIARLGVAVEGCHMAGVSEAEGSDGFLVIHFYDWFMSGKLVLFWPSALAGFAGFPEGLGAGLVIRQHLADGGEEQVAGDFGELAGVGLVIHLGCLVHLPEWDPNRPLQAHSPLFSESYSQG